MREDIPIEVIFSRRVVGDADPYELDCWKNPPLIAQGRMGFRLSQKNQTRT